jgi:hypothetical protein
MNGVNLNLFQFEYDLTWMAFFMDAEERFYARYGGRGDSDAESYLNKESLVGAMKQVLQWHSDGKVQTSQYEPKGQPRRTPEEIPTMKALMAPRKENNCIHCHDVKVAQLRHLQKQGRFERSLLFTYPTPAALGIEVDPKAQNQVIGVTEGSAAAKAGVRQGDVLRAADGQRILTVGDLARVLELTPREATLPVELRRGDRTMSVTLELSGDWRRNRDPSWRETLHVAGPNGGFWGMKLGNEQKKRLGMAPDDLAVRVTYIWGDYTRQAGLRNDDVVVAFDGLRKDMTIRQLHAHLNLNRDYGDRIELVVKRGSQEHTLQMQLPKQPQEP